MKIPTPEEVRHKIIMSLDEDLKSKLFNILYDAVNIMLNSNVIEVDITKNINEITYGKNSEDTDTILQKMYLICQENRYFFDVVKTRRNSFVIITKYIIVLG